MNRSIVLGFVAVLLVLVPGCANDPDSLMKRMISQMNDVASAIEKKESPDKIKSLAEKVKATEDKLKALKLSDDKMKQLTEKYQKELEEALGRVLKAAISNPEAMQAFTSIGKADKK